MTEFSLLLDLSVPMGAFHSSEDKQPPLGFSKHLRLRRQDKGLREACSLGSQSVSRPAFQPADGHRGRAAGQRREEGPQGPREGSLRKGIQE